MTSLIGRVLITRAACCSLLSLAACVTPGELSGMRMGVAPRVLCNIVPSPLCLSGFSLSGGEAPVVCSPMGLGLTHTTT